MVGDHVLDEDHGFVAFGCATDSSVGREHDAQALGEWIP